MVAELSKVAVIIGATSKWQADGENTRLITGADVSVEDLPVDIRWGVGGALSLKFADEGYHVVLTSRRPDNATSLAEAINARGGQARIVELDLTDRQSIADAFGTIRSDPGAPEVVIYNAGYIHGRELPPEMELLENMPEEIFETAMDLACRGPFLVAKEVLPAMREAGKGSFFFTNNPYSLHGRARKTGESLYYPRAMMRTLAQVLTEEYSPLGVHVANVIIDGLIDSPGTRHYGSGVYRSDRETMLHPMKIAEAYWYLHCQDPSCWSHELQLTPHNRPVSR
jgi:NAD(P)-dependent dehydrogenase (short-subunit alcohol dehydrogenase family)